ncbi:MAG: YhgE/Pip domain-containing protein [Lysinibacillus sp.]
MLKQEWLSLWKDKKLTLSIVVMFIMPLLYSGMLLWAFWDPYGHLDNLPVALVNNDSGSEIEGEELNLGEELVSNLKENATFKFIETTSSEATEMLKNQQAYIVIEIPEDFSQHATTLLDDEPKKLELAYTVDESSNFLSSKIGDSAINQIRTEVNEEVAATYAEQLFEVITKLSDGYKDAGDGASELREGVEELKNGTTDLKGYLEQLASGTVSLANGTTKLANGVQSAKSGASELVEGSEKLSTGSNQLVDGAGELQQGAEKLADGVTNYTAGVEQAASGSNQLVSGQQSLQQSLQTLGSSAEKLTAGANDIAKSNTELANGVAALKGQLAPVLAQLPEEQRQAIEQSLTQLQAGNEQVAAGATSLATNQAAVAEGIGKATAGQQTLVDATAKLNDGLQQLTQNNESLTSGASTLAGGTSTLASSVTDFNAGVSAVTGGIHQLDNGLGELVNGTNEVAAGTTSLSEKSAELASGSEKLVEGNEKLANGTGELAEALLEARDESSINVSKDNYEMVAAPVAVDKIIENEVSNYGTGLAPYFISLGLFVGALLLTNVYPFVQPAVHPTGVVSWFISKSAIPFFVWIAQTSILSVFLLYGLKLDVTNVPLFIGLMAVISFAFIAIVQLLTVVLGDVGRFIALVFLIVQLAASAGTFPVELLPHALQSFNDYIPMSYSVEALRIVISSSDYSSVYNNMLLLGGIGVACVVLSFAFFALLYNRRYSKLVEEH